MFARVLIASVLTIIGASTAFATSWIRHDVHLRAGPGRHDPSLGVLAACSRVDVDARHGGWLHIDGYDGRGWVAARHLADHRPAGCQARDPRHVIVGPEPCWDPHPRIGIIIGTDPWPWRRRRHDPLREWNDWHDW